MSEPKKKSNKFIFLLIGCGGLLALLMVAGVAAAVAIPSFLRYIKQSKHAEAQATLRMISDAAVGHYIEHCAFPPSAEPSSAIPEGGGKAVAKFDGPGWQALAIPLSAGEKYFSYRTESNGDTFSVLAEADFSAGGPHHVSVIEVTGSKDSDGTCLAESAPLQVRNEFQ